MPDTPDIARDPDLAAFVEKGAPQAFRAMVDRHLPAVHSTALRILRLAPHLAEDVAQTVFLKLARKAPSLPRDIVVGAWLHRQTVRHALNALRTETRRKKREQISVEMESIRKSEAPDESSWREIMPHVDQAILELSEPDRVAITLRFHEKRKMRHIAERLGASVAAVEKRIARALEKLRQRLARGGVAPATAAALGALMAEHAAEAAPPLLAESICGHAAAVIRSAAAGGGTTLTGPIAMTVAKSLSIGVVAGLLVGGALVVWQGDSAAISDDVWSGAADGAEPPKLTSRPSNGGSRVPAAWTLPVPAATPEAAFEQVRSLLAEPDNEITRIRLRGLLEALPPGHFAPVLALIESDVHRWWELQRVLPELAKAWGSVDPTEAMRGLIAAKGTRMWSGTQLATAAFEVWLLEDGDAAQRWMVAHQGDGAFAGAIEPMVLATARHLAGDSAEQVIEWARALEGDDLKLAAISALWSEFTSAHHETDHSAEFPRLAGRLSNISDPNLSQVAVRGLVKDWAEWRYDDLARWLDSLQGSAGPVAYEAALALARRGERKHKKGLSFSAEHLPIDIRIRAMERAIELGGDRSETQVVADVVEGLDSVRFGLFEWAIARMQPGADRDRAVLAAAERARGASGWSHAHPPPRLALEWIRHHGDAAVREAHFAKHYSEWLSSSRFGGAETFPEENGWPEELNARLREIRDAHRENQ